MSNMHLSPNLIAVLVFTLVVVVIEALVVYRAAEQERNDAWAHYNVVRLFGLTLIVGAVLVISIGGPDVPTGDRAAIFGLLGTLAGYFIHQKEKKD